MSAYTKVLEAIRGKRENGHAIANAKNRISLASAKRDIEKMMESNK